MNPEDRKLIANRLAASWIMFGRDPHFETLAFMVDNLADLPANKILFAIEKYCRDPKHTTAPTVGKLRAYCEPQQDPRSLAIDAASRVVGAVSKFGWAQGRSAREYIGELGWLAVERCGGWSYVCENLGLGLSVGTFQAQVRDACEAILARGEVGLDSPPGLPGRNEENLQRLGKIVNQLTEKKKE